MGLFFTRCVRLSGFVLLASARLLADPIDDYIRAEMKRRSLPGVALAVVKDGKCVRCTGYGTAVPGREVPVTQDTPFLLASVSKQFAATVAMRLVENGRLRLDDPVLKYVAGTPAAWNGMTVRHLLTHTSGLPDYLEGIRPEHVKGPEVVQLLGARPLLHAPGEKFLYSSAGYALLGQVLEKAGGKPFEELLSTLVFRPAGMRATTAWSPEPRKGQASGSVIDGSGRVVPADERRSRLMTPSGGVISTAADMATYESRLLDKPLLKPESVAAMHTPVRLNDGRTQRYGFGWWVWDTNGKRVIYHPGDSPSGFGAAYMRFPDERLAVIVLSNVFGPKVQLMDLAAQVADLYRGTR